MNIPKSLFFLILTVSPIATQAQSTTTAKGSVVTYTLDVIEKQHPQPTKTLSKLDSLILVKQAKQAHKDSMQKAAAVRKALLAQKNDSMQKAAAVRKALLAQKNDSMQKAAAAQKIMVAHRQDSLQKMLAQKRAIQKDSLKNAKLLAKQETKDSKQSPIQESVTAEPVVIASAGLATATEERSATEKNTQDSIYRNILGVKFRKNIDYKSKINAFEDDDNYALLEKGASFLSVNLGLASFKMDDKWIEPLVKIDDTYYTQLFVKASGGYFIANNTAVALKVAYGFYDNRIKLNSDILQLLINAKTYETNNVGTDVAVSAVVRNYVPIGFQQRFFLVTETAIGYKYSESLQRNIYDEGVRVSKVQTYSHMGMLGISPGVTYFMTKGFAFEFMLSPIQIYYKNSQSINNEIANGVSHSYGLTFAFTPLNIQLGLSYYFGLDYKKNHEYMSKYYNKVRR